MELEKEESVASEVSSTNEKESINKKERIRFAVMGLIWFLGLPLSLVGMLFKPLYEKVYYGQADGFFRYGLGIFITVIFIIVMELVVKKKMKMDYKKEKTILSWPRCCLVFFGSFFFVFLISALIGFEVKPFHDVGNNTTAYNAGIYFTKLGYQSFQLFLAINMIENFQYALDDAIPFKNKKVSKYIPYGGIATMLTYGVYSLCFGVGNSLSVLYLFLVLVYSELYILCDRSITKSFAASLLIFLL